MTNRFVAPRSLSSLDEASKSFRQVQEQLDALARSTSDNSVRISSFTPFVPSFTRVSPQTASGLTITLPSPAAENVGLWVAINIEDPHGPVTVEAPVGALVNGGATSVFTSAGLMVFYSNGKDAWSSINQLSTTSPTATAEVLLGAASASFPSGRVATASPEITPGLGTPNIVTWALNTASVAFSKLANLTGLSVLGRAATTTGVMAAITGTAARQVLMVDPTATTLQFADYEYQTFGETVTGTLTNRALPAGMKAGDTLRWTITGNVTLNSFAVPYPGFWFNLVLGDSSGGDFTITIVDEHAGSTADNRIRTPGTTSPAGETEIPSNYLMSSEEEAVQLASGGTTPNTRWRIIAGTAAQSITGAVSVAGGNGGTRPSTFSGIRDNGVLETARGFLNLVSSTSVTLVGTQDAANDEIEITAQRAALTGAIAATANSNATLFSGIRDNGAAENDRANLNFLTSSTISFTVTDDAANNELEITAALIGSSSEVTIASATGNLGTINIAALECGGSVRVTSASSGYSIEGFTAKTNGFWFYFEAAQGTTNHCTLFDEDATATAADRLQLPLSEDITQAGEIRGIFYYRNSRWNFCGNDPKRIGTSTLGVVVSSTQVSVTSGASDVNISAGGNANVSASGLGIFLQNNTFLDGTFDVTERASVTAPGAGHGKLWVDSGTVQSLRFTDDSGNDRMVIGGTNAWQTTSSSGTLQDFALNENTKFLKLTAGAGAVLGGIAGGWDGRELEIVQGANATFGVNHSDAGSALGNRISCFNSANMSGNRFSCKLVYDGADTVWRVVSSNN